MKILFVMRDYPGFGGGERRMLELAKRLVTKGHEVLFICGKTMRGLPNNEEIAGIQVKYLTIVPEWLFRWRNPSFYISRYLFYPATLLISRHITRFQPDMLVDCVLPAPTALALLARWHKLPCVADIAEYRNREQWQEVVDPVTAIFGFFGPAGTFSHLYQIQTYFYWQP